MAGHLKGRTRRRYCISSSVGNEAGQGDNHYLHFYQKFPLSVSVGESNLLECTYAHVAGRVNNIIGVGIEVIMSKGSRVRRNIPPSFCSSITDFGKLFEDHCGDHMKCFIDSEERVVFRTSDKKRGVEGSIVSFSLSPPLATIAGLKANVNYPPGDTKGGRPDIFVLIRHLAIVCPEITAEYSVTSFNNTQAKCLGIIRLQSGSPSFYPPHSVPVSNGGIVDKFHGVLFPTVLHGLTLTLHSAIFPDLVVSAKWANVIFSLSLSAVL